MEANFQRQVRPGCDCLGALIQCMVRALGAKLQRTGYFPSSYLDLSVAAWLRAERLDDRCVRLGRATRPENEIIVNREIPVLPRTDLDIGVAIFHR